jgi:bifunctional DNase/RNase
MIIQKNYTSKMEAEIRENSPITYDVAVILAEKFGKTLRSVVAKACSMESVVYIARERVSKNGSDICRKADLVDEITRALGSDEDLTGLSKSTKSSLENLLMSIR